MERREFIKYLSGGVVLLYAGRSLPLSAKAEGKSVRFGIVTDSHYADIDYKGSRFYRDSIPKMREAIDCFNRSDLDFIIELGDLKDMANGNDPAKTLEYLDRIEEEFQKFRGPVYHVLGNHDMDCISKEEFLEHAGNHGKARFKSYYSFDIKDFHFIVLDPNFNEDMSPYCRGNFKWTSAWIPQEQADWLKKDLEDNRNKAVIVFCHQMLDSHSDISPKVCVRNAETIRTILDSHKSVLAVFQGHHHPGHYSMSNGTHYFTLKGMIEKSWPEHNSYATVEIKPDGNIYLKGYKDCPDKEMKNIKD